ncbi:hypothetical protein G4B88_003318 [Cannabis sativa]|uniref:RNase H type-1 domain-containing protein n=1 Tax=Cannabis sativa TaxID=3483 RepID=A0A7J6FD80_CANSA|nr:hypothetical protein G4B88_003318 [Cannabis sativa]
MANVISPLLFGKACIGAKTFLNNASNENSARSRAGALVRNSSGQIIAARAQSIAGQMPPQSVEAWALLQALH